MSILTGHYWKRNNKNFDAVIFLRNREINFSLTESCLYADEIAFGSWWDLTDQDAKKLFNAFHLKELIDKGETGKLVYFTQNDLHVDWPEVIRLV